MRNFKKLKRRFLWMISAFVLLTGMIGISARASQTGSVSYSNMYALTVSTGGNAGDGIGMFIIDYKSNGKEYSQYIDMQRDVLNKSLATAREAAGQSSDSQFSNLEILGYTVKGTESSVSGNLVPLAANSSNTFLVTFDHAVDSIVDIQVVTDIAVGDTTAQWSCSAMQFYKVDAITSVAMNGYVSDAYTINFQGQLIAKMVTRNNNSVSFNASESKNKNYIISMGNTRNLDYYLEGPAEGEEAHDSGEARDFYVQLDLADVYGAGIESYVNQSLNASGTPYAKTLKELCLPESLVMTINYYNTSGSVTSVSVPVITSALCYALDTKTITGSTTLAEFAGQDSSIFLKIRLYDFKSFVAGTGNFGFVYDPQHAAELTGLCELNKDSEAAHQSIAAKIYDSSNASAADAIRIVGMSIYDAKDTQLTLKADSTLTGSISGKNGSGDPDPLFYFKANDITGEVITPSDGKSQHKLNIQEYEDGASTRPKQTKNQYLVAITTSNADLAATSDDVYLKLGYSLTDGADIQTTDSISLRSAAQDFYGYWSGLANNTTLQDVAYELGMSKGNTIYAIVNLNGSNVKFVTATLTLGDDAVDTWQCSKIEIYRIPKTEEGIGSRSVTLTGSLVSNSGYVSDRTITRSNVNLEGVLSTANRKAYAGCKDGETPEKEGDEPLDLYLDSNAPSKTITFGETATVEEDTNIFDWRQENYSSMPYDVTQKNLGFVNQRMTYTVTVSCSHLDYDEDEDSTPGETLDDAGSSNYFYFQLVFENGTSGYVQANQQLLSDGFLDDTDNRFTIRTNYDYGNLTAVNIIPDDSTTDAQPYDKLRIDKMTVSCADADSNGRTTNWVFEPEGNDRWVGIDYVDEGSKSSSVTNVSREVTDYRKVYKPTSKTTSNSFLISFLTNESSSQLVATSMTATIRGYKTGSTEETVLVSDINVLEELYNFTGEAYIKTSEDQIISNKDTMFRAGMWNSIIVDIADVSRITSISISVKGNDTIWDIAGVEIFKINSDNGRKIYVDGDYYVFNGEKERVSWTDNDTTIDVSDGKTSASGGDGGTLISLTSVEIDLDAATKEAYYINRTPVSTNDYVNIAVYMDKDVADPEYQGLVMGGYVSFTASYDGYYRSEPEFKKKMTEDNQCVFYANGVGVKNIKAITSLTLSAYYTSNAKHSEQGAKPAYAIIQQIRDGVIIASYQFNYIGEDATRTVMKYPDSSGTGDTGEYQKVTIQLGPDTETAALQAESSDIAVAIRYKSTISNTATEYQTAYVYLTDERCTEAEKSGTSEGSSGTATTTTTTETQTTADASGTSSDSSTLVQKYDTIKKNGQYTVTFNTQYVSEITGVEIVATGNQIAPQIESITAATYGYDAGGTPTTNSMTWTKTQSTLTGWYSCTTCNNVFVQAGSKLFTMTHNNLDEDGTKAEAIVPMNITFRTSESNDSFADPGVPDDAKISMIIKYTNTSGDAMEMQFDDIRDYLQSGSFKAGKTATIAFMEQNMENITSIQLRCYDDDEQTNVTWGLASLKLAYADAANIADYTVNVNDIVYEVNMSSAVDSSGNPTIVQNTDGLIIGMKKVLVSVSASNYDSVADSIDTVYSNSDIIDEDNIPTIFVKEENGSIRFTVKVSDSDKGVTVRAGYGSNSDATKYLSKLSDKVIVFEPPTDIDATYTVEVISKENPQCVAKIKVKIAENILKASETTSSSTSGTNTNQASDNSSSGSSTTTNGASESVTAAAVETTAPTAAETTAPAATEPSTTASDQVSGQQADSSYNPWGY